MTVSSTTVKNSYSGDGSNDTFVYGFKIFASSDLQVIIRSATGTETTKTLTTDYTITGVGSATGGNVVFESSDIPTATETVVLIRNVPQTQAIDYIANDPFPAETHEEGLDRATMTTQQMQEELDRSFKVSRTNTIASSEFTDSATTRASKTLGFDSSGNLTTVADFLPAGGDSALFQYSTTTADADPGAGKFRLNNATIASATIMYIDDLEFNGTNVEAWIQSWDDVAGNDTNRGRIRISKANSLDTWMVFKVTGGITNATGYSKVSLVYIDSAGTFTNDDNFFVSFVASGEDGTIPGYFYKFDTGTSDADPGAGELAFNNGTYASATVIYIDDADANGVTVVTDILTWDDSTSTIRGYLMIYDINDRSTYARFKITGASTDASGYVKLAVAHLASNNTFSAADELSVTFVRNGDTGDTGSQGPQGDTGGSGLAMTFSNSTSDADPGAGKIAFNNGTLSSVSILYVDDADDAGSDISSFVQSWDDISNAVARGIIQITKEGTPTTYANFKVTGAVTNATGYTKVPVTHIVSSGTFSNTNGIEVNFNYSGADGSGDVSTTGTQTLTNKTLTSPKIGTNILDTNGNELVVLTATGSAVNELTLANASTGNNPLLSASGGDSNVSVKVSPKGTGNIEVMGATNPGSIQLNCEQNTHGIKLTSPAHTSGQSYELKFPTGNVTADRFLKVASVSGSGTTGVGQLSFAEVSGGGVDWQSSIVTASTLSAAVNKGYWINTTSNACTITLPGSASVGDQLIFVDYARKWGTNAITINQNSLNFQGNSSPNPVYDTTGETVNIVYSGATNGWIPINDGAVALETQQTYAIDFLVIAAGGSGGGEAGGGGAAGGYRASTQSISEGTAITISVGDGGASVNSSNNGNNGSNSYISGTGVTTITSTGGGYGGYYPQNGAAGGSGGGGGGASTTGGAGNTPSTSPSQGNNGGNGIVGGDRCGGGGGGAGAVGTNASTNTCGVGGAGTASSITGSSVTRAGGGGGGTNGTSTPNGGVGGSGGGGQGGDNSDSPSAQSGTVNTGSGGGGCGKATPNSGAGGKGVIILSMADAKYSTNITGSPTVATNVGGTGKTVLTFTGTGTYTT